MAVVLFVGVCTVHERAATESSPWMRWMRHKLGRVQPRYPIILVHGVVGELELGTARREYFRGVVARLESSGIEVHTPKVTPAASVAVRARELARAIESIDAKRVNIIAHSMGGLDARYAIAQLGMGKRVASLTTVATPHRGTPIADLGTSLLGSKFGLQKLLSVARVNVDGIYDLTTSNASAFNERVKDVSSVRYGCVLAKTNEAHGGVNPLLRPGHRLLNKWSGANDGLVPVDSQVWGEVIDCIDADHWAQIGWSRTFDAPAFYEKLVHELSLRGL